MTYNEVIKAHELYQCGLSLSQVAIRFNTTRQRLWNKFKVLKLKTRPLIRKEFITFNGQKYFHSQSKGYWRKGTGNRNMLHRDVWEFYNGPIEDGFDIHHLDGNKNNNDIHNLEKISKSDHTKRHGFKNNQYTKKKEIAGYWLKRNSGEVQSAVV